MAFVLADQQGWLSPSTTSTAPPPPFNFKPLQTFAALRDGVNDKTADFFMWEHFTSKRYFDNESIKRVGEIYTPWSSWKIVSSTIIPSSDPRLEELFETLDKGVAHFEKNDKESVEYISTELDYSEEDAREWLKTVRFAGKTKGVDVDVIQKTVDTLRKAGVLGEGGMAVESMIDGQRGAQAP